MKKSIAIFMSLVFCCMLATGCGGDNTGSSMPDSTKDSTIKQWKTLPDYDLKKGEVKMLKGGYYTPVVTDESFQTYKDCGFDVLWINGENVGAKDDARIKQALSLAGDKGLKCIVDTSNGWETTPKTTAAVKDYGYADYPSFWAIDAFDEPYIEGTAARPGLDTIGAAIPEFEAVYGKNTPYFTNLFPLGASKISDYSEYIEKNVTQIIAKTSPTSERWISCDSYVLLYEPQKDLYSLKANWLANLQVVADVKTQYPALDIKSNFFILSTPHLTDVSNDLWYHRDIGYNELRLQMYSLIAFGYDMVSFFCYATPTYVAQEKYFDSLVDKNGKVTERWYDSKKLLTEINRFDHVFKQFSYKGVIGVTGSVNNYSNDSFAYLDTLKMTETGDLSEAKATSDTLISYSQDKDGNDAYTVVNYNDPHYGKDDKVEMAFKNANFARVYINGKANDITLVNHKLTLELGVGEGVFVIPY